MSDPLAPIIRPARYVRYAKMMAVHCPSDGSGLKTRAARLASALSQRYSNREKSYMMSRSAAARFKLLYEAGEDAQLGDVNGKLGYVAPGGNVTRCHRTI